VVEAELLLQLLVRLLADPPRLDGAGEVLQRRVGGQVGELVFAFAGRAMLADEPDLLAGQMLVAQVADTLGWVVGHADAKRCEAGGQPSLGATTPADRSHTCSASSFSAATDLLSGM